MMDCYSDVYWSVLRNDAPHGNLVKKKVKVKGKGGKEYESTRWVKPAIAGAAVLGAGLVAGGTIAYLKGRNKGSSNKSSSESVSTFGRKAAAAGAGVAGVGAIAYVKSRNGRQSQQVEPPESSIKTSDTPATRQITNVSTAKQEQSKESSNKGERVFGTILDEIEKDEAQEKKDFKTAQGRMAKVVDDTIDYTIAREEKRRLERDYDQYSNSEYDRLEKIVEAKSESAFERLHQFNLSDDPGRTEAFYASIDKVRSQFNGNEEHDYNLAEDHWLESNNLNKSAIGRRVKEKLPDLTSEQHQSVVSSAMETLSLLGISKTDDIANKALFRLRVARLKFREDVRKLDSDFDSMYENLKSRFWERAEQATQEAFGGSRRSSQSNPSSDWSAVLGVDRTASDSDVKKSFRDLAKKYHPDVNKEEGSEAKMKEIIAAYEAWQQQKDRRDSRTVYRF